MLRADAGPSIGAGHLMRCLTLARQLADSHSVEPVIATTCRQPELLEHVERSGIPIVHLDAAHPDPQDAAQVRALLSAEGAEAVIVDGYHFDDSYLDAVRSESVRTVAIDDAAHTYSSDLLLDHNLGALSQPYRLAANTTPLLGPRFSLVRPEFLTVKRQPRPPSAPVRVLVTMGAGDPANATSLALRAIARLRRPFDVTVVVGGANRHRASIEAACAPLPTVRIVHNARGLESLMAGADLAIAAVGGTMWELACLGVPALVFSLDALQARVGAMAHRYGAHHWLGDVSTADEEMVGAALLALADDGDRQETMSRLGKLLIDGKGPARAASAICNAAADWTVRPAQRRDAEPLWEVSGESSHGPHADAVDGASFADYERRFDSVLRATTSRLWVLERDGSLAGAVRYDREASSATVGVIVVPAARGRGLGSYLISKTWAEACGELDAVRVRSAVPQHDAASCRTLLNAGFRKGSSNVSGDHGRVEFERSCADG